MGILALIQMVGMTSEMLRGLGKFLGERRGNVAVLFGLAAVPMVMMTGMGIDYGFAVERQTRLNAIADAAALAGVSSTMMAQNQAASAAAAQRTFNAQAAALSGVTYSAANLSVAVSISGPVRTVTVDYTAQSQNSFPNVLGMASLPLSGHSAATAGMAPNIDFYMLLDDSPSMAIAATQAGINTMVANTSSQGGCAFGCHESHPSSDNLGNPNGEDNYALARNLGVTLRIDMLQQAVSNLMTTAQNTAIQYNSTYRMAQYTFDYQLNTIGTLTSNLSLAKSQSANIALLQVYANNWLTSSKANSDEDTNFDTALTGINGIMPNPGSGTNNAGDTPQEVMFFVTDGVEDENSGGSRRQSVLDVTQCNAIKSRGIRIAVLYTEYLPLPTNAWYNQYISPFQANIAPTLQQCASPGLYFEVQTGGDISSALASLFQMAVQTAYLSR